MKISAALIALVYFTALLSTACADDTQSLEDYHASLNRSCQQDSDCEVKDIHNCCGYYPACLNKAEAPDAALVTEICKDSQLMGVCGFPSIEHCECLEKKCKATEPSQMPPPEKKKTRYP